MLSRVDIFFIWNAILLVIGFGAADGLPRNKAIIGVGIILLVILLVLAGSGALVSSFSSGTAF